MKRTFLLSLLVSGAFNLHAQVEHKREWLPVREVQAVAPAPPHLEKRIQEFADRNSPANLQELAQQLFGLMNPDYLPEDKPQAELYRKAWTQFRSGKYSEALETYRDFSFARIRKPAVGVKIESWDPAKRTFIEFYNLPDELMQGIFRLQMFDEPFPEKVSERGIDAMINFYRAGKHNAHMVDVVLQNGLPGRMNWTYVVPGLFSGTWHILDEKGFAAIAYRQNMCFTPLLKAYLDSGDSKYLHQWVGYIEDMILNYWRDLAEAGIQAPVSPAGAGGPAMGHLAFLVLNAPNIDKDLPAATFARLQLRHWVEDLPLITLGSRATGANRAMHMYGALLTEAYMRYPELNAADSLLSERRRLLESYAHEYMMADGTSIDYAPNYNKNYINSPPVDVAFFSAMTHPPAWFSAEWAQELAEERGVMARYLIHSIAPDGSLPGYKDPLRDLREPTIGKNGFLNKALPESLSAPANREVVANLQGKAAVENPGFTSEAFPYGGYYIMRENWDPKGRYLYFHDYRPGENGNWRHHKNLYVQAFGQRMLTAFRWESPLLVDGAGNINVHMADLYPESYAGKRGIFGTHAEQSAWQEPMTNRWHTSAQFDFAEGSLKIPFADKFADDTTVFVDDVAHARQVIYLRSAGAWIVTDRIRAEKPHDYQILWGFEPAVLNPPGWEKDWRNKNKKAESPRENAYTKEQIVADPATGAIRTENPHRPNLSIFHAASLPVEVKAGDIQQSEDAMFGNSYRTGPRFRTERSAVVASLLYPRNTGAPDLTSFVPVPVKNGAGFDAKTPEGVAIAYRAGLEPQELAAGPVKAMASSLVTSGAPDASLTGMAFDCTAFSINGKAVAAPSVDFEFSVDQAGKATFAKIYRPLSRVRILPERNLFVGDVEVTLESSAADTEIRYTLDGSEPTRESQIYSKPIRLTETTEVRAVAFRPESVNAPKTTDSTLASIPSTAVFKKEDHYLPPVKKFGGKSGLAFRYYEGDWALSILKLPILKPVAEGVAREWMDVSSRGNNEKTYAFIYEGFLKVPVDGVYTFQAPFELVNVGERAGYDLQLEVNGRLWYPEARTHGYGSWSIPLAAGAHPIKLTYVDIRRASKSATFPVSFNGDKPNLWINGPELKPQAVPSDWLFH